MDDTLTGTRDKRGDWKPNDRLEIAAIWHWPPRLGRILQWFVGYLWPWNGFHAATALLWWFFIVPDMGTLQTLAWGWALWLLAINWIANLAWYGFFEWRFYRQRAQGNAFKYNHRFPADQASDVFWFKSQNIDNFLRSFLVTIPLWTLVQVLVLWAFANGYATWVSWEENPVYLVLLMLLAPAIHETHFYCIHRLIHQGPLYKWIHSIHHNSINPTPWSSLSMHPVEGFLYHAVAFWHLLIPSNPIVALFQLHVAGFGAINGHLGFEKMDLGKGVTLTGGGYEHYLHHKYFEVNYGGDGLVPLDKWFGTWHDGTAEGDRLMKARFAKKKERIKARQQKRQTQRQGG